MGTGSSMECFKSAIDLVTGQLSNDEVIPNYMVLRHY